MLNCTKHQYSLSLTTSGVVLTHNKQISLRITKYDVVVELVRRNIFKATNKINCWLFCYVMMKFVLYLLPLK